MYPPIGHDYGGANYTKTISVAIDGKKKVDCNLGDYAPHNDLVVYSIEVFPEDGLVSVFASSRGKILEPPFDSQFIENDSVSAIRLLAARKGLNYSTLMRMWITERLRREQGDRG